MIKRSRNRTCVINEVILYHNGLDVGYGHMIFNHNGKIESIMTDHDDNPLAQQYLLAQPTGEVMIGIRPRRIQ